MQRRLSAVLCYDAVEYSRAMAADEQGTLEFLKKFRRDVIGPIARSHSGRTVKLMGDGALMEFGSAVDAVTFAVGMQCAANRLRAEAATPLMFRVGINIGDVVVEDGDIYGDGVNVAARLEGLAEAGGICIARNVKNQIAGKLDLDLDDLGDVPVKNLDEPVHVFRIVLSRKAEALAASTPTKPSSVLKKVRAPAVLVMSTLLVIGGLGWWYSNTPAPEDAAMTERRTEPSVAVLPFDDFGGEERGRFLGEGIAEDITTELARNSDITIIARSTTFALREKGLDATAIARELGVEYVLEGSVRRVGDELRIVAQLIEGTTGRQVWAERYDIGASEIFGAYDRLLEKIAGTLFSEVRSTEKVKVLRRPPETLDVYELSLRGLALKHRLSPEDIRLAREDLKRAVELDPEYSPAWLYLGWVEVIAIIFEWTDDLDFSDLGEATDKIRHAISLDPTYATAYQALSLALTASGDVEAALQASERSVELGPGDADNRLFLARALASNGRFEEAVAQARKATSLNPVRPSYYDYHLGRALWGIDEITQSTRLMKDCLTKAPGFTACRVFLAADHAAAGNAEEASRAIVELHRRMPDFTLEDAIRAVGFPGDPQADDKLSIQLRSAGL